MNLAKLNTRNGAVEAYPYTLRDLRADHPRTMFPRNITAADLIDYDVVEVQPTERPAHDPITQDVIETTPAFDRDAWRQQWSVVDVDQEERERRAAAAADEQRAQDRAQAEKWIADRAIIEAAQDDDAPDEIKREASRLEASTPTDAGDVRTR